MFAVSVTCSQYLSWYKIILQSNGGILVLLILRSISKDNYITELVSSPVEVNKKQWSFYTILGMKVRDDLMFPKRAFQQSR